VYIGLEDGVYMSTQDAGTRQDLIANSVSREVLSISENVDAPENLGSAFESEVEHDLLVWPREYLETYLDRDKNGSIPLNEVQLQDLLEAAFERDEKLARNAIASLQKTTNGPTFDARSAPDGNTLKIATESAAQQKEDRDRASLAASISQLSDSVRAAAGCSDLVQQHRQVALTDSGVYSGKIVSETPEVLIQRISAATEVAHPKSLFSHIPQIGQLVRIAYQNNVANIRELQPRRLEREMER
jgi:hypothetical protein